jgi:hypothetical protein
LLILKLWAYIYPYLDLQARKWQEAGEDSIMRSFITCMLYHIRVIKSRKIRWTGHVAHTGEMRNTYNILVGKHEGKRSLRIPRHRWEDNIRMDFRERGWKVVIHLAENRDQLWTLVNTVMNIHVSYLVCLFVC